MTEIPPTNWFEKGETIRLPEWPATARVTVIATGDDFIFGVDQTGHEDIWPRQNGWEYYSPPGPPKPAPLLTLGDWGFIARDGGYYGIGHGREGRAEAERKVANDPNHRHLAQLTPIEINIAGTPRLVLAVCDKHGEPIEYDDF